MQMKKSKSIKVLSKKGNIYYKTTKKYVSRKKPKRDPDQALFTKETTFTEALTDILNKGGNNA